jgi:hypothetical protein
MAIKQIREIPRELPLARLYLEDLEEISHLLQDCIPADSTGQLVPITYRLIEETADSIDDLKQLGSVVSELEISVPHCSVTIRQHFASVYSSPSFNEGERWKLYSLIKQIFERRERRIVRAMDTAATRLLLLLVALVGAVTAVLFKLHFGSQLYFLRLSIATLFF